MAKYVNGDIVKIKKTGELARIVGPAFGEAGSEFISSYSVTIKGFPSFIHIDDVELYRTRIDV